MRLSVPVQDLIPDEVFFLLFLASESWGSNSVWVPLNGEVLVLGDRSENPSPREPEYNEDRRSTSTLVFQIGNSEAAILDFLAFFGFSLVSA